MFYPENHATYRHQTCTSMQLRTCTSMQLRTGTSMQLRTVHSNNSCTLALVNIWGCLHPTMLIPLSDYRYCNLAVHGCLRQLHLQKFGMQQQQGCGASQCCRNLTDSYFTEETGNRIWKRIHYSDYWYIWTLTLESYSSRSKEQGDTKPRTRSVKENWLLTLTCFGIHTPATLNLVCFLMPDFSCCSITLSSPHM